MSNEQQPHPELVIIKRGRAHQDGHHGGAWKIAFADFMTAMMALFLVLWLISATTPKMRVVIARYFNPVKLADVSADKKGLNDPAPGAGPARNPAPKTDEAPPSEKKRFELPPAQEKKALFDLGGQPGHDETALFRDPYAVLAEIVSQPTQSQGGKQPGSGGGETKSKLAAATQDLNDSFRDPFATVPSNDARSGPPNVREAAQSIEPSEESKPAAAAAPEAPKPADALKPSDMPAQAKMDAAPSAKAQETAKSVELPSPQAAKDKTPPGKDTKVQKEVRAGEQQAAAEQRAAEADAGKLQGEIAAAMRKDGAPGQVAPNVEVKGTDEGVLISLTDENNYAMFAVGSAEPQRKTIEVMEKIAQLLKGRPGMIVVRGHTDGRPYKSLTYDNWQLSAARAQMAHYMLVRGGLDEARIERIEGYADHRLKLPNDPLGAENRRIEILLRKDKS